MAQEVNDKLVTVEEFEKFKLEVLGILANMQRVIAKNNEGIRQQNSVQLDDLLGKQERTLQCVAYLEEQWKRFSRLAEQPSNGKKQ